MPKKVIVLLAAIAACLLIAAGMVTYVLTNPRLPAASNNNRQTIATTPSATSRTSNLNDSTTSTKTPQTNFPSHTADFTVKAMLENRAGQNEELTLQVTQGKVCQSRDNGQPQRQQMSLAAGISVTFTRVYACSGSYQDGKLSYSETVLSEVVEGSGGTGLLNTVKWRCEANGEYVYAQLDGTFSSQRAVAGNYTWNSAPAYTCDAAVAMPSVLPSGRSGTGKWTGEVAS